ncbi:MAG TPA: hypothetical protein VJL07_02590 [Dehalococcoidia bacterium]|nr:hypothetical protein [Dehalococcoidia bacterium]
MSRRRYRRFVLLALAASIVLGTTIVVLGAPCDGTQKCAETRYSWSSIPACAGTGAGNSLFIDPDDGCLYRCDGVQVSCPGTGLACSDCVALGAETSGNYADSTGEGGPAVGLACSACVDLGAEISGSLPLANLTDDATSSKCLLSGGGGGDPAWGTCPGGGGDSITVDTVAVVDPDFASTADIDFINTSNVITANVNANSVALGTDTTGDYALGDAEGGAALDLVCDGVGCVNLETEVGSTLPPGAGGTGQTVPTDDNVLVGNGTTWDKKAIPSCQISSNGVLNYNVATNALSCGTMQAYQTVQDETSALTQRIRVNFTGAGVTCADNAGTTTTDCTIPGGTGGNSFETMDASSGTDPVADSPTDTLIVTGTAPVTVTGDATADSLTIAIGDADASNKGVVQLAGDLAGTAAAPIVADNSVDGTDIALGSDAQGDVMYYNGTDWARLAAGTAGNVLTTNGAGANPAWTSGWITITKTADESITEDATLNDDAALLFAMAANTKYRFRLEVFFDTGASEDFKYRHAGPASPTLVRIKRRHLVPSATSYTGIAVETAFSASDVNLLSTGTNGGWFQLEGIIHNGANAGNFSLQWAQAAGGITSTVVRAGSYLEYSPL